MVLGQPGTATWHNLCSPLKPQPRLLEDGQSVRNLTGVRRDPQERKKQSTGSQLALRNGPSSLLGPHEPETLARRCPGQGWGAGSCCLWFSPSPQGEPLKLLCNPKVTEHTQRL